jgi:hypothetical protein
MLVGLVARLASAGASNQTVPQDYKKMPQRLIFTCIVVRAARSIHGVSENRPTNHRERF